MKEGAEMTRDGKNRERHFGIVLAVCALAALPLQAEYIVGEGSSLIPAGSGIGAGDSFHLVFVSSTLTRIDDWGDRSIAAYNSYVNTIADTSAIAEIPDLTWYAIASTASADARDNALVEGPVYRLGDGVQVATGYADMWDGEIGSAPIVGLISTDEDGQSLAWNNNWQVWSGTQQDGTVNQGLDAGSATYASAYGNWNDPDSIGGANYAKYWINLANITPASNRSYRFYGLSEKITVTGASILLSDNTVSSNAAPGTLVGVLSVPTGSADDFVMTNAPAVGSSADNAKFQVIDGSNLCTAVWMSQYSNNIVVASISNGIATATNAFYVTLTAASADPIFQVSAEVQDSPSNGDVIGLMKADTGATFSIVGGRTDLFTQDVSNNLLVTNEASWGGVGTTNYVTIRATTGTGTSDLTIGVEVVGAASGGTIFLFR